MLRAKRDARMPGRNTTMYPWRDGEPLAEAGGTENPPRPSASETEMTTKRTLRDM
jgi:hypothetical protein